MTDMDPHESRNRNRHSIDHDFEVSLKRHKHRHGGHHEHRRTERKCQEDDVTRDSSYLHVRDQDYDMEEGEIVEEEYFRAVLEGSDVESGEIKVPSEEKVIQENSSISKLSDERDGDGMAIDSIGYKRDKREYQGGKRENSHHKMVVKDVLDCQADGYIKNKSIIDDHRLNIEDLPHQFFLGRYHEVGTSRSRSISRDHARDKSQSRNNLDMTADHNSKDVHDLDDRRLVEHIIRDKERGDDTKYDRYNSCEIRGEIQENRYRYKEERDKKRDRRVIGVDREMENASRNEKERDRGDRGIENDRRINKEGNRHGEGDRRGEKERDWNRDMDTKRDYVKERERDKDKDRERENERLRERVRSRDMETERLKEHTRNKDNGTEWLKDRSRSRDREERGWIRDKNRERYSDRDKARDRARDSERGKVGRHHKYEDANDCSDDRDKYRTNSRHSRHDIDSYRDKALENNSKQMNSKSEGKLQREEDEQEDYQEKVELQLAEQEEEDLNRIKEESRRRRRAILEKYNAQSLQKYAEPENIGKDKVPMEKPDHKSALLGSVIPGMSGTDKYVIEPSFSIGKLSPQNELPASDITSGHGGLGGGTPKSEKSENVFCDDIFGDSPAGIRKTGKEDGLQIEKNGLDDNWDDAEGYYSYRLGEILDARYEVTAAHGKGVFSTVVRAKDLKALNGEPEEVAIKIIRNNDTMYKAGMQELIILKKLAGADPDDRRHCVRFISHFKYRNHLCLVFESLHMNLREVLKKFGRNIGLKLTAVRAYAKQLFIALKHLRNCGVLHCDIKPDNMLVNDAKNVLKLCDFGNAMFAGKNEITPYLVSRFYRAPEIILGLPYDHPLDIWSVGCCLFELYSGKVLFPGPSNNDMLRLHMELKGPFPKKMLRKGAFIEQHFDQDINFHGTEEDPVTKKTIKRLILNIKPKDIGTIIIGSSGEDAKMLSNFKDILDKIFVLDPEKRMTVSQALNHPFITGK